jgi:hypothetical protein
MVLTTHQKTDLTNNQAKIQQQFNVYVGLKDYMGVYFNKRGCAAYLTFKNSPGFSPAVITAGNTYLLACVYDLSLDFTTQTTNFLTN